ncbi:hypothetical protein Harman_41640 [Haloarcula mannanilytica]|uniref:Uncharacterized protein n=1 Tax=Haloarcula mannanilytica TaxID=2509225 RepID=A0A4C2EVI5_9EURY|nr:hypothetical protein [Haloarcula mannanilytica]GCF16229.1 hypothetical protein Harman_41640 [Haloarcula mannanilytica]
MTADTSVTTEGDTVPEQPDKRWLRDMVGDFVHDIRSKRPAVIGM